jgi:hypothetical protein
MATYIKVDYRWVGSMSFNWASLDTNVSEIQAESMPEAEYYESNDPWNSQGTEYFSTLDEAHAWIESERSNEVV